MNRTRDKRLERVRFLGTGTSQGVPVIGCDCEVCHSPSPKNARLRSSLLVSSSGANVVIDTGPDFRQQMLEARVKRLDAVVYTHEHKDHLAGMDDIRPFNYLQQRMMPLYASERVQQALKRDFHYAFDPNKHGGVPQVELVEVRDDDPFEIDGVRWTPLAVMHGQLPIHGYLMDDLAYITDANHLPDGTLEAIKGVDTLVLNALRPAAHYSHFSLAEALEVAKQVGARQTWFTHISHLMGLHMEVNAQLPAGVTLAYDGLELERRNDGWHELAPRLAIRKVRS